MKRIILFLLITGFIVTVNGQSYMTNGVSSYSCPITTGVSPRSAFLIDNNGNDWIGFASGSSTSAILMRYNGSIWTKLAWHFPPATKVYALACDGANNVWVGTSNSLYEFQDTNLVATYSYSAISLACGGGNVYVGTKNGLYVYNGSTFTQYTRALNGLKSDTILSIAYESNSAVWLGEPKGLDKFDGTGNFTFTNVQPGQTDSVMCIYIDPSSYKWLGTNHHGVIRYDNSNFSTMAQLYGTPIGIMWPSRTYSISKGPTGGISFADMYMSATFGYYTRSSSLLEISGTTVHVYRNVASSQLSGAYSYYLFQYNWLLNKFFFVSVGFGGIPFLFSFNPALVDQPSITQNNSEFLDINNAKSLITSNADMHCDLQRGQYFTPKNTGTSPLHGSALWMGGYHNGSLRMAAMTYRQNGMDFWPGPLDPATDSIDAATSAAYDKVWKVNRFDIANFIYNWNAGNVQNGTFYPAPAIVNWPANGNGVYTLAPFVDVNGDGYYDPMNAGDYPLIKGDQMIWWVFNDKLNKHSETGGATIGVQVNASAYAFTCPGIADSNAVLNNTTFYNFKVMNVSPDIVDSFYITPWLDADLGNYQDDYIGCDVMNNFGYIMNGDMYDEDNAGMPGYHNNLPIFSCNILNGPAADANDGRDNDNDGVIDEPNEKCMMHTFTYYTNTADPQIGSPNTNSPQQYYNYMNARWRNGTRLTYGGTATTPPDATHPVCHHLFPGNSDPYGITMGGSISSPTVMPAWTEQSGGMSPANMRFLIGVGPFTMQPGGTYELDYALVFSQDSLNCYGDTVLGGSCALPRTKQDNMRVKHWFDTNTFPSCLSLNGVGIHEYEISPADVTLYPNPASNQIFVSFKTAQGCTVEVMDITGKIVTAATFIDARTYHAIPVSSLAAGMYAVRIRTSEGTLVKKFIKE